LLDSLQSPFRRTYQSLGFSQATLSAKGPYAIFDNVSAIFAANPVITRTATYIYACAEWIQDAFQGKELLLEIYSRLLNPTFDCAWRIILSIWKRGLMRGIIWLGILTRGWRRLMGALSHLLGRDDILITSRNIYGGAHQLIHDWFAKPSNLDIAVETFEGFSAEGLEHCWQIIQTKYKKRLSDGRKIYVYLESPSNPHGDVLDVPEICAAAHRLEMRVLL